ncbi:MAG: nucleotidyltransferase domain-containing protein, partial [Methanobacteriota archaeon]
IVSTINEIQQNLQIPSSLTRKILEKGKVLYG